MKNAFVVLGGLLAIGLVFTSGCNKNNGPTSSTGTTPTGTIAAIEALAASDSLVQNDDVTFADNSIQSTDYGSLTKTDSAITPIRWGRFINSVTRTMNTTMEPGDTLAVVTINKTIVGVFKIQYATGNGDTIISKPFQDKSVRNLVFRRAKFDTTIWYSVATSLVAGGTNPAPAGNAINITQVQVFFPNDTVTVTDPTNYYLHYLWENFFAWGRVEVPLVHGGDKVTIQATVVSASADTDLVALRYGFLSLIAPGRRQHMALVSQVSNGDGTFTRVYQTVWHVHFHFGFFNTGIDAVTRGTLYDNTLPYSASWWGIPYRVW